MKVINRICIVICVLIIGFVLTYQTILIRVPLGSVGVMTQQYAIFGSKGVKQKDFGPGWHLDLGPIHTWNIFDSTAQTLEKTRNPNRGDRLGRDDVQLKSADGYNISLDMTVKYKIKTGMAHKLFQKTGSELAYKALVRSLSDDTFRRIYGGMKTEEFYNPEIRRRETLRAEEVFGTELAEIYVEVLEVLVRDIEFDPQYEEKILLKKLADQEVELNKSEALAAGKRGETQEILARADANVKVIQKERDGEILKMQAQTDRQIAEITATAEKYATETSADADLFAAETIAHGTLLVRQAEAEGERLTAQALSGPGGANLVALESARNISLTDMTLSTVETDFLDVDFMVRMLGASGDE